MSARSRRTWYRPPSADPRRPSALTADRWPDQRRSGQRSARYNEVSDPPCGLVQSMADHVRTADRVSGADNGPADATNGTSLRAAFLDRAISVIERIASTIDELRLKAALDAGSDSAVLTALGLIQDPTAPTSSSAADPLMAARTRGEQAKRDILAAQGEMLSADGVAARLGNDVAEVERRRHDGLLVALPLPSGAWAFPAWQFADGELLPGLEDVLRSLPAPGPWSRILFLQSGDPYLNRETPLELIRRGEIEPVRRLAAAYDELVAT